MLKSNVPSRAIPIAITFLMASVVAACGGGTTDSAEDASMSEALRVKTVKVVAAAPAPTPAPAPAPAAPAPAPAATGTATVAWSSPSTNGDGNASAALTGYRLYYGTVRGEYPQVVAVSGASSTAFTVAGLSAGTYYMVITAVDSIGNESTPSAEISKVVQ